MREGIALTAFTPRGEALARRLADALGGRVRTEDEALASWTARSFAACEALIFVGAAGIAVRSIAPLLDHKTRDPAVLCVEETGRWVIPLLSGHLGGANALARRVAALTGGEAVVTTATDTGGVFAVDLWAKRQGLLIRNPERIKTVSAALLRGEAVTVCCPFPIRGEPPALLSQGEEGGVRVSFRPTPGDALTLVPRALTLGVGCRRGTDAAALETAFRAFCAERRILPEAVEGAASITLKRDEAGLAAFCREHGWPLRFFTAEELGRLEGDFTASAFVRARTGVDNVCERAALLCAGGTLVEKKYARAGVTFALAARDVQMDWRWEDGDALCGRHGRGEA